ncbi:MAG: bifunctional hydroxymethylpyrimidine kinase/phosphomethylpyrimidine kinase [Magnetococcales bacterium]|nr:bifunctional hydroxymethylpyrimidine kinase/phosphomethylpyrimidine kinase [Magnetococcales bacterium]
MIPRVLIVAGSDPIGGAGLQADLLTVTHLGCLGMTAATAITVQDTSRVQAVHPLPAAWVSQQMAACLEDVGADVIKLGMLGDGAVVEAVAAMLERHPTIPVVADPVLAGTGGGALLDGAGRRALLERLLPRVTLLTPNLPETEALTGLPTRTRPQREAAARRLTAMGVGAALLKGGHAAAWDDGETSGETTTGEMADLLWEGREMRWFFAPRLDNGPWHGTGCMLAAATAAGLARGLALVEAVELGRRTVRQGMIHALAAGRGQKLLRPWGE